VQVAAPSKSQVNKAGRCIRRFMRGELVSSDDVERSVDVLIGWRAAHQYPLGKATMGLRSMVKTEGCAVEVSQRLKRAPTIVDKLVREPTLPLASMQDIGGCRAVLASIDEVRRVQRRLQRNRPPVRVSDYIAEPRASGYRGVHVIVEYDERAIEVQLRTRVMHEWAITVERLSGRLSVDLKSSHGPEEVLDFLQLISEAMAAEERGETVSQDLLTEMAIRREAALPWLAGGRS
jgi:putative GTP pyrophosphokinase